MAGMPHLLLVVGVLSDEAGMFGEGVGGEVGVGGGLRGRCDGV